MGIAHSTVVGLCSHLRLFQVPFVFLRPLLERLLSALSQVHVGLVCILVVNEELSSVLIAGILPIPASRPSQVLLLLDDVADLATFSRELDLGLLDGVVQSLQELSDQVCLHRDTLLSPLTCGILARSFARVQSTGFWLPGHTTMSPYSKRIIRLHCNGVNGCVKLHAATRPPRAHGAMFQLAFHPKVKTTVDHCPKSL